MLSKYDEFPVHQASRPFAHIPSTDFSWDEGYYSGVFSADERAFLLTGMRINPNADMVGGYAIINVAGRQYSVRFSRCWRRQIDTITSGRERKATAGPGLNHRPSPAYPSFR